MFHLFLPFVYRCFFIQHSFQSNFVQKRDMYSLCSWKCLKISNQALSGTMITMESSVKLASRPFSKRHMECLEVKNCLEMKSVVFVAVLGEKTSVKWSVSLFFLFVRIVNSCFITYTEQFFSFTWKNALKMQRMWMLVNYVALHHPILSDALHIKHMNCGNITQIHRE